LIVLWLRFLPSLKKWVTQIERRADVPHDSP
jgi:hypothetical protein